MDRIKRPQTIDLERFKEKRIRVRFTGGREVVGILKSFDGLQNIVLDEAMEYLRDPTDALTLTDTTRYLGLVVVRGTAISIVGPEDGFTAISNPFAEEEGGEEGEAGVEGGMEGSAAEGSAAAAPQ